MSPFGREVGEGAAAVDVAVLPAWVVVAAWHEQAELVEGRGQVDSVDRQAILVEVMSVRLGAGPEPLDRQQWPVPISTGLQRLLGLEEWRVLAVSTVLVAWEDSIVRVSAV